MSVDGQRGPAPSRMEGLVRSRALSARGEPMGRCPALQSGKRHPCRPPCAPLQALARSHSSQPVRTSPHLLRATAETPEGSDGRVDFIETGTEDGVALPVRIGDQGGAGDDTKGKDPTSPAVRFEPSIYHLQRLHHEDCVGPIRRDLSQRTSFVPTQVDRALGSDPDRGIRRSRSRRRLEPCRKELPAAAFAKRSPRCEFSIGTPTDIAFAYEQYAARGGWNSTFRPPADGSPQHADIRCACGCAVDRASRSFAQHRVPRCFFALASDPNTIRRYLMP